MPQVVLSFERSGGFTLRSEASNSINVFVNGKHHEDLANNGSGGGKSYVRISENFFVLTFWHVGTGAKFHTVVHARDRHAFKVSFNHDSRTLRVYDKKNNRSCALVNDKNGLDRMLAAYGCPPNGGDPRFFQQAAPKTRGEIIEENARHVAVGIASRVASNSANCSVM